jgi:SAM-dependent methyltransferase
MTTLRQQLSAYSEKTWWRLMNHGFHLLYNDMAWTYDSVSWAISLGEWRDWQRAALRHLPREAGTRILELAHGTANLQLDLHAAGFDVTGIDLSPHMGRIARRKLSRQNIPFRLARARSQALPFRTGTFAAVVSTFPTNFITEPATLSDVYRVLQPGGWLVFVANGVLNTDGILGRGIEALYTVTGQRGEWPDRLDDRFTTAGFALSRKTEPCRMSVAEVVIAQKLATASGTSLTDVDRS